MADLLFGPVFNTLQTSLNGLSLRQQVISRNLANIDTPGYQAQNVTFEAALQQAQATPRQQNPLALTMTQPAHLVGVTTPPREPVNVEQRQGGTQRVDGNNVDVDVELTQMADTGIRYQAFSQLITGRFQILRNIIK